MISRREFMATAAVAAAPVPADIPRVDYHVHLDARVTLEKALEFSSQRGVKFGIVEHAGAKEYSYSGLISSDDDLKRYLAKLEGKPVFKGIQAEGVDWAKQFSPAMIARLDYVLTDALTFPEKDGRLVRLWTPEVRVGDRQDFMERYTAFHVRIMAEQPIDILANPTLLPAEIEREHDALWTPARMRRIVAAAVKHGVAIEINTRYRLPRLPFLRLARDAGARFSFGSNIHGLEVGKIDYGLEMVEALKLTARDIFTPAPAGRKPIQHRRGL